MLGPSGFESVPLGHGSTRMTHHVFPVFYLCGATLPRKINLRDKETQLNCYNIGRKIDVIGNEQFQKKRKTVSLKFSSSLTTKRSSLIGIGLKSKEFSPSEKLLLSYEILLKFSLSSDRLLLSEVKQAASCLLLHVGG